MFDYVPPEKIQANEEPTYLDSPIAIEENKFNPYTIEPTDKDLLDIAYEIKALFDDGFQWKDIASMMKISIDYLDDFLDLSIDQKRDALIKIFNHLVDITDVPFIPDSFIDPIFKKVIPSFVPIILPDSFDELFPKIYNPETLDEKAAVEYGKRIIATFDDGFQWMDIAVVARYSISICSEFISLTTQEKIDLAKGIISYIIDETDFPKVPDFMIDPIVEELSHGFIEQIFEKVIN